MAHGESIGYMVSISARFVKPRHCLLRPAPLHNVNTLITVASPRLVVALRNERRGREGIDIEIELTVQVGHEWARER
jgi:hypothetical protein